MRYTYKIRRALRNTIIFLSEVQERHELESERRWGE